jgi:hypothetical protein
VGCDGFLYSSFSTAGVAGDWKTRELLVNDDFELARISYLYEGFT